MKRASAPQSHDDKLCHSIKYPDNIVDNIESKIRYGDAVSSLWQGELLRLKQGAEVRMSEEREKGDTAVPHEEARPRETIVAAEEIRHLTSHLLAIDNTPSCTPGTVDQKGKMLKQTVLRSVVRSIRRDGDNSVGKYLLGHRWKGPYLLVFVVNLAFFGIGSVVAALSLWNFIPRYFIYAGVICIPCNVQSLFEYNIDVAKLVLVQRNNLVFWFWCLVLGGSLTAEYQGQNHYGGILLVIGITVWTMCIIPLFDCLPNDIRGILNKLITPMCTSMIVLLGVSLSYNWVNCEGVSVSVLGHAKLTSAGIATSSLNNIALLSALNVVATFLYPDSLVSVRSRVEAIHMAEGEAVFIRSYDALSNEIAEKNRISGRMGLRKSLQRVHQEFRKAAGCGDVITKVAPTISEVKEEDYHRIEYPEYIGDDMDAKIRYCEEVFRLWRHEVSALKAGRKGEGDVKPTYNSKGGRSTITAVEEIRIPSSHQHNGGATNIIKHQIVLRPVFRVIRGDIDNSVGKYLLGDRWKGPYVLPGLVNMTLYAVGGITGALSLWNFIPRQYIYVSTLMLPSMIHLNLECHIDIAKLVVAQHNNLVFWFWCIVFAISLLVEYKDQDHYGGIALFLLAAFWAVCQIPFFDCLHVRGRALMSKLLMPICNILLILWVVSLSYNWADSGEISVSFLGHIKLTTAGLATSALNNIIVLVTLNIVATFLYPDSLVSVRSRVEAIYMEEVDAVRIRSYDALSNEIAEKNRLSGRVGLRKSLQHIYPEFRKAAGRGNIQ